MNAKAGELRPRLRLIIKGKEFRVWPIIII